MDDFLSFLDTFFDISIYTTIICIILLILLYMSYLFLGWSNSISDQYESYLQIQSLPDNITKPDISFTDNYLLQNTPWIVPPLYTRDSYGYLNFWINYYCILYNIPAPYTYIQLENYFNSEN
jgi:hypothetical protein